MIYMIISANQINNIIILFQFIMFQANYRLALGCHSGRPSPTDTYGTYLQNLCLNKPFIPDFV